MKRLTVLATLGFSFVALSCSPDEPAVSADVSVDADAVADATDADGQTSTPDAPGDGQPMADADAVGPPDVPVLPPPAPAPALTSPVMWTVFPGFGQALIQPSGALDATGTTLGVAFGGRASDSEPLSINFGLMASDGTTMMTPAPVHGPGGLHNEPSVCALAGGGWVVVWSVDTQTVGPDGENLEVRFRLVGADGALVGPAAVRVLTPRPGNHWLGEVACGDDGGFVVAGVRPDDTTPAFSVFMQRYDGLGGAVGDPYEPLDGSDGGQVFPDVDLADDGTIVAAWEDTSKFQTPDEMTVIALSTGLVGGGIGPLVVPFSPGAVEKPAVAVHRASGAVWVAAMRDQQTVEVALLPTLDAAVATPVTLTSDGGGQDYHPVLVATPHPDAAYLLYLSGTGATVTPYIVRLRGDKADVPVALETGQLPPYVPALTYGGGRLVALWTMNFGGGSYGARAAVFGPD